MNRAERRRQQRELQKQPVYNYTPEQLKNIVNKQVVENKKEIAEAVVDKVLNDYITLSLSVLYDKFDFNKEQLLKFKSYMDSLSDCVTQGHLNIKDLNLMMIEELEINLLSMQEPDVDVTLQKMNEHKRAIFNSGCKAMFLAFVTNLNTYFNFGKKRAGFSAHCALATVKQYLEEPEKFYNSYNEVKDNVKLSEAFKELEDFLKASKEVVNFEDKESTSEE